MNFSKTYNFIFIFLYAGLCFPSASYSDADANTKDQLRNASLEVNVSKNYGITQKIYEDPTLHTLKPRFEANWRYSDDRSILMGEFWLPLIQCEEESVLFCDIRLMGDDNENKEFNVGVGYREVLQDTILGDGVAGGMIWFDRRFTDRDFQFNQVTVGGEWLGAQYDLRMNGYFPIDKKKIYQRANPNGSGEGFVGNQILVNTDQVVVEEVLPGIDFELGSQLNFMNGITDSTRFFVGGYHFEADIAEDITGVRTRIVSDITSDVQVGARFQHDDVRGSQTYIESTIRFPFGHKKKYKHEGLWTRLDEAPERDIDVVSNEAVTVPGINETLLNATTGLKQNVIHVDNTAAGGGDGSIETPYNTLAGAEGAATTNDLIYVHRGDGTTAGQNVGIALDDAGQMLTGAGTNLLYNTDRFSTSNGLVVTDNMVLKTTTAAPVITNGAGNGVNITADDVFVSGITVDGATANGINALNANNVIIDNVESNNALIGIAVAASAATLSQVTFTNNRTDNNATFGLFARALNGGDIETVNLIGNTVTNTTASSGIRTEANGVGSSITTTNFTNNRSDNNQEGLRAYSVNSGNIGTANLTNNSADGNTSYGFIASSGSNGDIGTVNFTSNSSTNNTNNGFYALALDAGSTITTANFTSNTADTNGGHGLFAYALSDGDIGTVNFRSNTASNNTLTGIRAEANGIGSSIITANFTNNTSSTNGLSGLLAYGRISGSIGLINFTSNTAENNADRGLWAYAQTDGDLGIVNITGNIANNNTSQGFYVLAGGAGSTITSAHFTNNTADSNDRNGLYVFASTDGDITTVNYTGNTATNNAQHGFRVEADGVGSTITTANFTNNRADDNSFNGFFAYVQNDGDMAQVSLEDNTSTDNGDYGFGIDDDSAAGGIAADLGGGAFASTGGNSSSGNTSEEILVDLDGGVLKAENNWWGSSIGLTGGETLLQDASTVDANPFLTSDPGLNN